MSTDRDARPRTIVGVFAHPDDEALLAGGTIARYVAEGARAAVLTCTGGEAGDNWDPTVDPARIGEVRREELRDACRRLGVEQVDLLRYRDSGIPPRGDPRSLYAAQPAAVAREIGAVLRRLRPDVVITHDPGGGYGHPDHCRVSDATVLAVRDLEQQPLLYHAVIPQRTVAAFAEAFSSAGIRAGRAAAAGADMEREVGVPDEQVTATIDISAHVATKRAAVRAHRTQMTGHVLFRLPVRVLESLWCEEHFARAGAKPGGPLATDLFEREGGPGR